MGLDDKRHTSHLLGVPNDIDLLKTDKTDRFGFVHKFGSNMAIGISVEDVQSNGGIYTWPQATFKAEIVSTDVDDTALGDGARSVIVQGLKFVGSYLLEDEEEIPTDGQTPVVGLIDWFRINRAWVEKSGVYGGTDVLSHQGDISIQTEGGGEIHAQLIIESVDLGQSLIARFSVPSNAKAHLQNIIVCVAADRPVRYFIFQRKNNTVLTIPFTAKRTVFNSPLISGASPFPFTNPFKFDPNTDVWFAAVGQAGVNNEITVDFELTLKYFDLP